MRRTEECEIFVCAELERGLPVAKEVVRHAHPRLEIFPRRAECLGVVETARGGEPGSADTRGGKRDLEVVESQAGGHGQAIYRPPVLDKGAVIELVDERLERRRH